MFGKGRTVGTQHHKYKAGRGEETPGSHTYNLGANTGNTWATRHVLRAALFDSVLFTREKSVHVFKCSFYVTQHSAYGHVARKRTQSLALPLVLTDFCPLQSATLLQACYSWRTSG